MTTGLRCNVLLVMCSFQISVNIASRWSCLLADEYVSVGVFLFILASSAGINLTNNDSKFAKTSNFFVAELNVHSRSKHIQKYSESSKISLEIELNT